MKFLTRREELILLAIWELRENAYCIPIRSRISEITGEHDMPDVHALSGAINAGIKNSKRVIINGAGHLVHMEQPEEFNKLVIEFLQEKVKIN